MDFAGCAGRLDAILKRAAEEEIVVRSGQKVLTAEDAVQLFQKTLALHS